MGAAASSTATMPVGERCATKQSSQHMLSFSQSLLLIRQRMEADLGRPGLPRNRVLAAVLRLKERSLVRVGNPEYAKQNNSFGLTTLQGDGDQGNVLKRFVRGKSNPRGYRGEGAVG